MVFKNNKGLTLIELLVALSIALIIMGLISGVLIQSYRNMEISDTNINLRQEANIIVSMLTSAHLSPNSNGNTYLITYSRISSSEWELIIGDQVVTSREYDIRLELQSSIWTSNYIFETANTDSIGTKKSITVDKKVALNVVKLKLTNKKDHSNNFELSTIISRL